MANIVTSFLFYRKEFFKEAGEVIDVRFPLMENGKRKGFGYVEFATVEAAQKVSSILRFLFVFAFLEAKITFATKIQPF